MSTPAEEHRINLGRKVLRALDNRILNLTILPTEKCNFRCTYCYEDFIRPKMPRPIVNGLKTLLSTRANELRVLDLRWFGGEPLLALDVVKEVSQHAMELAQRRPHLQYVSGMTTNAYLLTPTVFQDLLNCGVRSYQISLDGFEADHDKSRRRADGKGTFDIIWNNLRAMKQVEGDFHVMLRVHFSPSTFQGIKKLVEEINKEFSDDSRFRVFFKAIARLGGANNDSIERSPWEWQKEAKSELTNMITRPKSGTVDPTISAYVCYAAEPNSLVIRSDGSLARCTVAFDDPRNQVGQLQPDGELLIDHEVSRIWFEGLESMDQKTLYCPLNTLGPPPEKGEVANIPLPNVVNALRQSNSKTAETV